MDQLVSIKTGPKRSVVVTDAAVAKIRELMAAEQTSPDERLVLRMAVRPGGCSGFSYEMFFDTRIDEADIVERFGDVEVVVDPDSLQMVKGATLDYRDGLMGAGFAIDNPNVSRTCGCGNSFS